ncbi:poly [ADP-ribose] polymerase 6 [Biomphalaria glabrata]|nr:poly [ADP-ribose] polymerase 6-like [Biomphalaria glabrata]
MQKEVNEGMKTPLLEMQQEANDGLKLSVSSSSMQDSTYEEMYDSELCENFDSDDSDDDIPEIHPLLQKDIQLLQIFFPQSCIKTSLVSQLCQMDLTMCFPLTHLNEMKMRAWGLCKGFPINIRLTVNSKLYLATNETVIAKVFQETSTKCNSVLGQLERIARYFCTKQFSILTNEIVQKHIDNCSFQDNVLNGFKDSESGETCELEKKTPSLDYGLLSQIYYYMQERITTLSNFCPICDNLHPGCADKVLLKPVVCTNTLCMFTYQTFEAMTDLAHWINVQPEVVQLLILLTKAAIEHSRDGHLSPAPLIFNPENSTELIVDLNTKCSELREITKFIPDIKDMLDLSEDLLKNNFQEAHIASYPFLRWIISSLRAHIEYIPPEKQFEFMTTDHQFLLLFKPPREDTIFNQKKNKYGSVFAFHGSPIFNWHSIIREGLLVASGTSRQLNGAAYGNGIYLSPNLHLSLGYSCFSHDILWCSKLKKNKIPEYNRFLRNSTHIACVTLCEVINDSHLKKHTKEIWTCEKSENVTTRFFFVYDRNSETPQRKTTDYVDTERPKYADQFFSTLNYYSSLYS